MERRAPGLRPAGCSCWATRRSPSARVEARWTEAPGQPWAERPKSACREAEQLQRRRQLPSSVGRRQPARKSPRPRCCRSERLRPQQRHGQLWRLRRPD
eukprot:scaffold869_cov105-Isochrysis_galbana.AAC.15